MNIFLKYVIDVMLCSFLFISKVLVFSFGDKIVWLWNIEDGSEVFILFLFGYLYGVNFCCFLLFGILFVIVLIDCNVYFWDVNIGFVIVVF